MLLTATIFASTTDTRSRIEGRAVSLGDINLAAGPEGRPSAAEMARMINSQASEVAFIEFGDRDDVLKVDEVLLAACPAVGVLGFSDNWQQESLVRTARGYIRVVPTTIATEDLRQILGEVMKATRTPGPDNVIVFMPAKAGSGASTVALNVTGALANKCVKSTILIEADLHSGPAGMYLDLNPTHSVIDALQESHRLDTCWQDLITPVDNFAILPASNIRNSFPQPTVWAYRRLLAYTRPRHEFVIFDLPEMVNKATEAIVLSAKVVYLVCTPELPSLMLARKRAADLMDRGVAQEKLQIVLNRYGKDGPQPDAVAEVLGFPIAQTIPNDYKSLWQANLKRRLLDSHSAAGRACEAFAWGLTGRPVEVRPQRKLFGLFPAA